MVAGEFAVLEPNQKLIVMAVDRFVYATITRSKKNQLTLENLDIKNVHWHYAYQNICIDTADQRINFVQEAIVTACDYLYEQAIIPEPFTLHVNSELDDESGKKYGLGSSAAVVTAVITAILTKYLDEQPTSELIFKLAAISHVKTQGNGSGADIAASVYGGVLQYTSFQAEWLLDVLSNHKTLTDSVTKKWTYLSVDHLKLPGEISICIGWTGKPASTARLVDQVLRLKTKSPKQFREFLAASSAAVAAFLQGAETGDIPLLLMGVKKNRACLAAIGKQAHVEIETILLNKLATIAEQLGGAGKLSGAGGGDCGIAFMPSNQLANQLRTAWEQAGIKPLSLTISPLGARAVYRQEK